MFDPQKIKKVCEEKKVSIKELCEAIGVTTAGFHKMILAGEVKASILEKISVKLDVPIGSWFDEDPAMYTSLGRKFEATYKECKREVEHLKQVVELKDELLESMRRELELLRPKP